MSFGGGQSLEDKLYAIKYFISGQGISFVVLKATTSELVGPKRKHLNYLLSMTNESNVSIPNLIKYLMQRAKHNEWSVAFKSLITIHQLMSYGNERFIQNLASSNINNRCFAHLTSFMDRTSSQAYNMSTFLRRYSLYINAKISTYRSLGLDFCRMISTGLKPEQRGLREMPLHQLVTTLPILQEQFDTLIAFDASPSDLNNGIINSAFSSLYKDFVKLYIAYQTIILRLLELYFMVSQLKRAQELYEAYKRFLVRMDKVSDFMRVIDSVGMDKSDLPTMSKAPNLSLQLLENHLKQLEIANSKRIVTSDSGTKWKPIELPIESIQLASSNATTSATLGRRRSSLLLSRSSSPAIGSQPAEIPRLKCPDFQHRERRGQRRSGRRNVSTTTTGAAASDCDSLKSPVAASISPSRGESAANKPNQAIIEELAWPPAANVKRDQASNWSSNKPATAANFESKLTEDEPIEFNLLLDVEREDSVAFNGQQQQPDLMLLDEEEQGCPRGQDGTRASNGFVVVGSQQPDDWVKI